MEFHPHPNEFSDTKVATSILIKQNTKSLILTSITIKCCIMVEDIICIHCIRMNKIRVFYAYFILTRKTLYSEITKELKKVQSTVLSLEEELGGR